jgi:hypothetical protein
VVVVHAKTTIPLGLGFLGLADGTPAALKGQNQVVFLQRKSIALDDSLGSFVGRITASGLGLTNRSHIVNLIWATLDLIARLAGATMPMSSGMPVVVGSRKVPLAIGTLKASV